MQNISIHCATILYKGLSTPTYTEQITFVVQLWSCASGNLQKLQSPSPLCDIELPLKPRRCFTQIPQMKF